MESQRTRGRVSVCLHRSRLWRSALCPGWWLFRSLPWPRWDPARPLCPKPLLSSTLLAQHSNGCSRDTTSTHANCSGGLCLQASWQSLHTDREGDCPALFHLCSSHFVFKGGQTARGRDALGWCELVETHSTRWRVEPCPAKVESDMMARIWYDGRKIRKLKQNSFSQEYLLF